MWAALIRVITGLLGSSGKRLLAGMGLGLATSGVANYVLNYYFSKVIASMHFGGLMTSMMGLLGLANIDTAISIVLSAYVVKFTMQATKLSLTKLKK